MADGSRYAQAGKADFVDVTVSQGTDTVQVRATFPNPDRILVDGQLVSVVAEIGKAAVRTADPAAGAPDGSGRPVRARGGWREQGGGAPYRDRSAAGTRIAVTKGLKAGEKVITEGVQKVRPGQVVQATEVKPQA